MLWITGGASVVIALAKALPSPVTDFLAVRVTLYWIVDVRGWTKWAFFFKVIGMNAITIYLLQWAWSFPTFGRKVFGGVASMLPEACGLLLLQIGFVLLRWLVLLFLYRRKIFLRV